MKGKLYVKYIGLDNIITNIMVKCDIVLNDLFFLVMKKFQSNIILVEPSRKFKCKKTLR